MPFLQQLGERGEARAVLLGAHAFAPPHTVGIPWRAVCLDLADVDSGPAHGPVLSAPECGHFSLSPQSTSRVRPGDAARQVRQQDQDGTGPLFGAHTPPHRDRPPIAAGIGRAIGHRPGLQIFVETEFASLTGRCRSSCSRCRIEKVNNIRVEDAAEQGGRLTVNCPDKFRFSSVARRS